MSDVTGSQILAKALKNEGVDTYFYIMGGPMGETQDATVKEGIRPVDVRHEQAAAMMAHAYARVLQKPGVCMAASGPGTLNLVTGVANANVDCAPVVAIGGSSQFTQYGRGVFQEFDLLATMKTCTKYAERVYSIKRIPEHVTNAFNRAVNGKPGPVYLDFPRDMLAEKVPEESVNWGHPAQWHRRATPMGDGAQVAALAQAISEAKQPIILSGSGVIWSKAWDELRALVKQTGIPFYTTPQGRGVIPDDDELAFPTMRSLAFREADLIIIVGTRMNFIIGHASAPRFAAAAKIARIDIDTDEFAASPRYVDIPVVGDCKMVLQQLLKAVTGKVAPESFGAWRKKLADGEAAKRLKAGANSGDEDGEIHPRRLAQAVRDFARRDAIIVVDGQEILHYGRLTIPTFTPGHRLNSGPFGIMGVGLPFGVGAKVAAPDKQVIVLHGDGSFGLNAMELDTAVRHNVPLLCVVSLNGGWTGDPKGVKTGRDLGYTRYDKMAEGLGCYGEYVEEASGIIPALQRAQAEVDKGRVAVVNVKTSRASFRLEGDYAT